MQYTNYIVHAVCYIVVIQYDVMTLCSTLTSLYNISCLYAVYYFVLCSILFCHYAVYHFVIIQYAILSLCSTLFCILFCLMHYTILSYAVHYFVCMQHTILSYAVYYFVFIWYTIFVYAVYYFGLMQYTTLA